MTTIVKAVFQALPKDRIWGEIFVPVAVWLVICAALCEAGGSIGQWVEFTAVYTIFCADIILFLEYGIVVTGGEVSSSLILLVSGTLLQLLVWVRKFWAGEIRILDRCFLWLSLYLSGWGFINTILSIRHSGMTRANAWGLATAILSIFINVFSWAYHKYKPDSWSRTFRTWEQELRRRVRRGRRMRSSEEEGRDD